MNKWPPTSRVKWGAWWALPVWFSSLSLALSSLSGSWKPLRPCDGSPLFNLIISNAVRAQWKWTHSYLLTPGRSLREAKLSLRLLQNLGKKHLLFWKSLPHLQRKVSNGQQGLKWTRTDLQIITTRRTKLGREQVKRKQQSGAGSVAFQANPPPAVPASHMAAGLSSSCSILIQLPVYSLWKQ